MIIRKLNKSEYQQVTSLSLDVYTQCGKADFNEEGYNTFNSFISSEETMNELTIYGAFDDKDLIGIIGTKNAGQHVSLLFIRKEYHRKGIGKRLFNYAIANYLADEISVNSSTYAIPFYQSLGFEKTDETQEVNGMKYTPMKLNIKNDIKQ